MRIVYNERDVKVEKERRKKVERFVSEELNVDERHQSGSRLSEEGLKNYYKRNIT